MHLSGVQARTTGLVFASFIILALFIGTAYASSLTGLPKADGTYAQWTPSMGTAHWSLVDEAACNGTTDYVSVTTTGNRDSYVISTSSIPVGAAITQVAIKPCASRNSAGGGSGPTMNVFYRYDGVNSADSGAYVIAKGTTPADLATTTFSGLALLQGTSSTLEIGAVYSSGANGVRLSRIVSSVTYTVAPSSLSASATTTSAILLSWTDASDNETGFSIERSLDGSSWSVIASTSANATSYINSGLSAGTTYYYRVRGAAGAAFTGYTNTANATTVALTPPNAPSALSATAATSSVSITLAWTDNSSDETAFEILRSTDNLTFTHLASTTANVTTYADSGLPSGTTYYYQVRAYGVAGYSSVSNTASATTGSTPTAPNGLHLTKFTGTTTTDVLVIWADNSSNETGFVVERQTGAGAFIGFATTSANATTQFDTGLTGTSTLTYRVRAFNGFGYSAYSNTASTTLP